MLVIPIETSQVHAREQQCEYRLLDALRSARLTIPEFLATVRIFRLIISSDPDMRCDVLASAASRMTAAAQIDQTRLHPAVAKAIGRLESHGAHMREATLARELSIDASHLGRLLHLETGMRFREWRMAARLRLAVKDLVTGNEQVRQIAFRSGWSSPNQFDRHFREFLGLSPSAFRVLASARSGSS